MKKRIALTLSGAILLGTVFSVAYASNQETGSEGKITFVGDEYYKLLPVKANNPVLLNRLQDHDYAQITESLVDESVEPSAVYGLKGVEVDENAAVVDNILPDGRYLKENWIELQHQMIEEALSVTTLNGINSFARVKPEEFETTVATGHGEVPLKFQEVLVDEKNIAIPKNADDFPLQFAITPDGQNSLVSADNGLWLVNDSTNQLEQLSSSEYNGTAYEQLVKESIELHGENIVFWNEDIIPSPNSEKLIYSSNKNNIKDRGAALFVLDVATGEEKIITNTEGANYLVEGWLNSESILCQKIQDSRMSLVIINLDGTEVELNLEGEAPYIYAVQDGLIAYGHVLGSSEIHIARVNETGDLQEVSSIHNEGTTRLRASNKGFSSDNSYFAFIYVPDKEPEARYIKVVDIRTNQVIEIDSFPASLDSSAAYLEFSWVNESTLLLVAQEKVAGANKMSTWTYSLN